MGERNPNLHRFTSKKLCNTAFSNLLVQSEEGEGT